MVFVTVLVSCKGDDEECTEHIDNDGDKKCDYCEADMPDDGPSDPAEKPAEKKTSYTVSVKTAGGMPIEGATVIVYADNTLDDLEGYASTDANGVAGSGTGTVSYPLDVVMCVPTGSVFPVELSARVWILRYLLFLCFQFEDHKVHKG